MGLVTIRNAVRTHLFRERAEVLLAVLIPFVFMVESGYACAWILVDGRLGLDFPSFMAFARGFAIEAFVFVCFKLVRIFVLKGLRKTALLPFFIGLVGVIVSAGMNLGWMIQSPEMRMVMTAISSYMPSWMANVFRLGLGLLFPVGVALFALFDVRHLVDEMIASAHLDDRAFIIQKAEIWRSNFAKMTRRAIRESREHLKEIADADAQNMVKAIRAGDMSFGMRDLTKVSSPSVTRVSQVAQPAAIPHRSAVQLPTPGGQALPPMPPLSSFQKPGSGNSP
jgi:hypothetical protein